MPTCCTAVDSQQRCVTRGPVSPCLYRAVHTTCRIPVQVLPLPLPNVTQHTSPCSALHMRPYQRCCSECACKCVSYANCCNLAVLLLLSHLGVHAPKLIIAVKFAGPLITATATIVIIIILGVRRHGLVIEIAATQLQDKRSCHISLQTYSRTCTNTSSTQAATSPSELEYDGAIARMHGFCQRLPLIYYLPGELQPVQPVHCIY